VSAGRSHSLRVRRQRRVERDHTSGLSWTRDLPVRLAFAAVDEHREDEAERYLAEALSLSQELEYEEGIAYYLLGAAALAVARGESHRGVQLLGRMDVLCDEIAFSMNPTERELRERTLAAARASLGESVVETALAEGGVRSIASMRTD
jgi:hypothetical protein